MVAILYLCIQDFLQYNFWYEKTCREICSHISERHGTQLGPYFGDLVTSEPPYSNRLFKIEHISTLDQLADLLTKPLDETSFKRLRKAICGY